MANAPATPWNKTTSSPAAWTRATTTPTQWGQVPPFSNSALLLQDGIDLLLLQDGAENLGLQI